MITRSRELRPSIQKSSPRPKKQKEASKGPSFFCACIKTECPHHLVKGMRYMVFPKTKHEGLGVATYWDAEKKWDKWYFIGFFPLDWFDVDPIRKWVAEQKRRRDGGV